MKLITLVLVAPLLPAAAAAGPLEVADGVAQLLEAHSREITLAGASVPIILALVELVKTSLPRLEARWWPLTAVVCGAIINTLGAMVLRYGAPEVSSLAGLVAGLIASGLYDHHRSVLKAP